MSFRVLFVPHATSRVAATRLRINQFLPALDEAGISYTIVPMASDWTTRHMLMSPTFRGPRRLLHYVEVLLEKILRFPIVLYQARHHDVVFLQRTTLPFRLERLLRLANPRIIFDFDDSIFMADPESNFLGPIDDLKAWVKPREFRNAVSASRMAIAGNEFLRRHVEGFCKQVRVMEESVDARRYTVKVKEPEQYVTIGWIGSPSTSGHLKLLEPVLRRLAGIRPIRLKLVGAGSYACEGVPLVSVDWTYESEVPQLQTFDIGIMPTPPDKWGKGKLGTKMLQYMAVGVPAVVSFSEANAAVIRHGVNGLVARGEDEWFEALRTLVDDPALRRELGLRGRKTIEEKFSLSENSARFVGILEEVRAG
ncbi:MAG: glycosyltransferase family 4 protein [Elusimicrobia bacterium]|nr:glycosyltransferase family 4 protein [Elusimicrobiota bacterium]